MAESQIFSLPNILIIDDVNSNLVILSEAIRNAGYIARPVASARQAVNAIEALPPSLILMDISMPEIDGLVFCSMLKNNITTKNIPVIFITALSATEDKIKGFKAGAVDYISKPYEIEEVLQRINTHLQMYQMKQEMEAYNKRLFTIINDQIKRLIDEQKLIVNAISKVLVRRDSSMAKHFDNIAKNSRILAMSLQMSPKYLNKISSEFVEAIELAAPLHDIGKLQYCGKSLLLNKDSICSEEIEKVKTNIKIGADLLEEIYSLDRQNEYIRVAVEIAENYHEHWDGTGYPFGIKGTDIPLSARIISIVHEYDKLIHGVENSEFFSHDDSIRMINEASGSFFDPEIVSVFNKIQHQLKY